MRRLATWFLTAAALSGMLLGGAAFANPALVRVGEVVGTLPPHAIRGFNYGLSMQVARYAEEFAAISIGTARYPPGNDADNFPLTTDMMDALERAWRLIGSPEPVIVANFFEGPEHALAASRYLDALGLPVRYWEIGNEPDLYPKNRMDPSWTPEVYCQRFRKFASALRAEDPGHRIAGPAVSGSRPLGENFLKTFLRLCGDAVDVLTWHIYPTDGSWDDAAALATSDQVGEEIRRFRSWLADPAMNPLGHERAIGVAITEFGLSWRTQRLRHLEDMTAAIWLADALGQMAAERVDMSHYFALQGLGGHGLIDNGGWVRPTYHVYAMLADFRGSVRSVASTADALRAYAVEGNDLQVLIVNRSEDAFDVTLELPSAPPVAAMEVATLDADAFEELFAPRVQQVAFPGPFPVPARSVVRVRVSP